MSLKKHEFGVKKCFLIENLPTKKMGDQKVPTIHIAGCTRWGICKALGRSGMWKCCWGKCYLEELGPLPLTVKGISSGSSWTADTSLLKRFWCSSSGYIWSFGSMGAGQDFGPHAARGNVFSSAACPSCRTCSFGLLSLKINSASPLH